jgi:adenylosuccinate lyase
MENIASWHERDLSNSANERFTVPMTSILLDEMLNSMTVVIRELKVNKERIAHNIELTKGQIYAEFVLDALIKKGVARFDAYRDIQRVAFSALESDEHFFDAVSQDKSISSKLSTQELTTIFDAKNHMAGSGRMIENISTLVSNITKKR